MSTIGGPGISDGYGTTSGGGGLKTTTFAIPGDFATVTAALAHIDEQGGVATGSIVTLDVGAGDFTDSFDFVDKDYSRVVIQGAAAVSSMISNWTNFAGTVGNYTLEITVDEAVATAAAAAGYVLVETGLFPNTEDRAKVVGYWRVVAVVNSTTLRIAIPAMDTMTAPVFGSNLWRATAFRTMFRNYVNATPFMKLTRSKGPRLKDVGIVGNYTFGGYAYDIKHTALELMDGSELKLPMDKDAAMTARGIWVGIHGYTQGVALYEASRMTGALAISGCDSFGMRADEASVASFNQLIASSNGRGTTTWGVSMTSSAKIIAQAFSTGRRASYIAGNAGRGVYCIEGSDFVCQTGAVIGNTGNDVEAASSATTTLGSTSTFTLGTVSPAVNTNGNSNAYNRRY